MEEYRQIKKRQTNVSMQIQDLMLKESTSGLTDLEKNERTRLVNVHANLSAELENKKHSLLNDSFSEYASLKLRREELIPKDKKRTPEENSELAELNRRYNQLVQELGL
jgi:hypothetical protein